MKKILLFTFLALCFNTRAQVQLASDINQGNYGSHIEFVFEFNNETYFSVEANEDTSNPVKTFWKTDGTENGTVPLDGITLFNYLKSDNYYFYFKNDEIWRTDGSNNGDVKIDNFVNNTLY